jgi:hypothetical protein
MAGLNILERSSLLSDVRTSKREDGISLVSLKFRGVKTESIFILENGSRGKL